MMVEAVEGTAGVVVAKVPWPASRWVCSPLFKLWIFIYFSLLCDCLWRVDANLAVPRPLEKWLFGGFKLLNLSCNSFLEEVEQLAGLIGLLVWYWIRIQYDLRRMN